MKKVILVAGATGNLGLRIVKALLNKDAEIRVLIRSNSDIGVVFLVISMSLNFSLSQLFFDTIN